MTNDTQSGEVGRLRAALQEIIDVHKNVPTKMNSPPFLRMTWIANRRREIAELALSEQPQPTGRTDSERLDWLIACVIAADRNVLAVHETLAAYGQFDGAVAVTDAVESMRSPFVCNLTQEGLTREAIDAAMGSAKGGE